MKPSKVGCSVIYLSFEMRSRKCNIRLSSLFDSLIDDSQFLAISSIFMGNLVNPEKSYLHFPDNHAIVPDTNGQCE